MSKLMMVCTKNGQLLLPMVCAMCTYREPDMRVEGFGIKPCIYEVRPKQKEVDKTDE